MNESRPEEALKAAKAAFKEKDYGTADNLFSELLMTGAFRAAGFYGLGVIRLAQKKTAEADSFFEASQKLDGSDGNAAYYRGVIAEQRGQAEDAQKRFAEALRANPNHEGAREKLNWAVSDNDAPQEKKSQRRSAFMRRIENDKSQPAKDLVEILNEIRGIYHARPAGIVDAWLSQFTKRYLKLYAFGFVVAFFTSMVGGAALSVIDPQGSSLPAFAALGIEPPPLRDWQGGREFVPMDVTPWLAQRLIPLYGVIGFIAITIAGWFLFRDLRKQRYVVDEGRISIERGAAQAIVQNVEIYRITDISQQRGPISQITGHATVRIVYQDALAHPVLAEMHGLPDTPPFRRLIDGLRESVLLLRTFPYLKGPIE